MQKRNLFTNILLSLIAFISLVVGCISLITSYIEKASANVESEGELVADKTHGNGRHVLFISSYDPVYSTVIAQQEGIFQAFAKQNVSLDIVYMDTRDLGVGEWITKFYESLSYRIHNHRKYDAILLGDDDALVFAQKYQDELFPETPLVFFGVNNIELAAEASKNRYIAGIPEVHFVVDTIEQGLRFNPNANKIVVIYDTTATGKGDYLQINNAKQFFADKKFVEIVTSKHSKAELQNLFSELKKDSVLLLFTFRQDGEGDVYTIDDTIKFLKICAPDVPVYRTAQGGIGNGVFGGKLYDFYDAGFKAANIVLDVFDKGLSVLDDVEFTPVSGKFCFDFRLLKKYGFDKTLAPVGTEFINKTYSFWEQNCDIVLPFSLICFSMFMFFVLMGLNFFRVRRGQLLLGARNKVILRKNQLLKTYSDKLKELTENDFLTNIPNRFSAVEQIKNFITNGEKFCILLLDIDNFKNINDYYTHECGDCVLKEFAERLKHLSGLMDCLAARYGGDEFIMIFRNRIFEEDSPELVTIKETLEQPLFYQNSKLYIKFCGGISSSCECKTYEDLISNADLALYEAKRTGKNKISFFCAIMRDEIEERNRLSLLLDKVCKLKQFSVYYQPQINTETGDIHGCEALCRLEDLSVSPAKFIPVAEECGYIPTIGRIVTEKVISQLVTWRERGIPINKVAINFSNGQLVDTDYVEFLASLLKKYDIPAKSVEIEITESLFMGNTELARQLFSDLAKIGVSLALDDFGTGYSSLSYLTYIPVGKVKIDKSLVDNYLIEGKDTFIKNIARLVHDLGMKLTVEGIEWQWQYERLRKLQCDFIQGYYFARPMTGLEVEHFYTEWQKRDLTKYAQ